MSLQSAKQLPLPVELEELAKERQKLFEEQKALTRQIIIIDKQINLHKRYRIWNP